MKICDECGQEVKPSKLELAGQAAAAEAIRLWELDIFDPAVGSSHPRAKTCLAEIERIIRANGWSWALPYKGNGPPQWCGMFAGDCWRTAGLDPSWLPTYFASTYRLNLWASYQKFDVKSKPNPRPSTPHTQTRVRASVRDLLGVTPRPGDIIIVGDGEPQAGDHVTICVGYKDGVFDTISGNGGGYGPTDYGTGGAKREGISRRDYTRSGTGYRAMWLIRPAEGDLL